MSQKTIINDLINTSKVIDGLLSDKIIPFHLKELCDKNGKPVKRRCGQPMKVETAPLLTRWLADTLSRELEKVLILIRHLEVEK